MNKKSPYKILLVPDRFAHYRYSIFKKISESFFVEIYAPQIKDSSNIEIAHVPEETRTQPFKINWVNIKSISFFGICLWQSKIINASTFKNYDICIYWGDAWRITTWISAIGARLTGKKVFFWTHGLYGNENYIKKNIRKTFYKLADELLLYGNHAKVKLKEIGFDEKKIHVINNSLDIEEQDKIYNRLINASPNTKEKNKEFHQLIFIGRLEKNKNLDLVIKNLKTINEKLNKPVKFLIVGDGTEAESLKQLCIKNNVEDLVNFYGSCYKQSELAPLIFNSSICVSPGNVGLTAMQALVYGIPVITHNDPCKQMPEYEAVIEGFSGSLYDYNSSSSFTNSIIRCIGYLNNQAITRDSCRQIIMQKYTPDYQLQVFKYAVDCCLPNRV